VIAAIEWIVGQVRESQATSIMHMSITGTFSSAVQQAIAAALATLPQMLHVVAAAGNSGGDTCNYTPGSASLAGAITVAAIDKEDKVPGFSNFGSCVTLWAPGTGIISVGIGEPAGKAIRSMSGTSMAAPVVSGVVALILSYRRTFTSETLRAFLLSVATPDIIKDLPGSDSPNALAFSFFTGSMSSFSWEDNNN
jgi:subtilisin family serine protease